MNRDSNIDAIEAHYTSAWSPPMRHLRWDRGPIGELPRDFRVLVVPRTSDTIAYATAHMSQPEDEGRLELHLLTRNTSNIFPDLVELLTATAHYHRHGQRLGLGHTVNFGRPWQPGSACTHGLISLPYLDGPELEWLIEPRVRFLWMIPITPAELKFKIEFGLEALEARFESGPFDYLEPLRPSLV